MSALAEAIGERCGGVRGYEGGWLLEGESTPAPFLPCATAADVRWSDELEALHEDASRTHFLDRWTREALLASVRPRMEEARVAVDLGCSTGYLLEDLRVAAPGAAVVGVDLVASGLRKAHELVPEALLVQADAADVPLADESADVIVSANLLEHVEDDVAVLREARRILRERGLAAFVVPYGPGLYDYYDAHLGHLRRYGRAELRRKVENAGLRVRRCTGLGALLYPPFWLRKHVNRRASRSMSLVERERRVRRDIASTQGSRIGTASCAVERRLFRRGVDSPAGIRLLVVATRG